MSNEAERAERMKYEAAAGGGKAASGGRYFSVGRGAFIKFGEFMDVFAHLFSPHRLLKVSREMKDDVMSAVEKSCKLSATKWLALANLSPYSVYISTNPRCDSGRIPTAGAPSAGAASAVLLAKSRKSAFFFSLPRHQLSAIWSLERVEGK